jgi:hypothetical protein
VARQSLQRPAGELPLTCHAWLVRLLRFTSAK